MEWEGGRGTVGVVVGTGGHVLGCRATGNAVGGGAWLLRLCGEEGGGGRHGGRHVRGMGGRCGGR